MKVISFYDLAYTLIPLFIVWYFYNKWTLNTKEIPWAVVRMVVQLVLIGYVLIFIFEKDAPVLGVGIIIFMIAVSSFIALRNIQTHTLKSYSNILFAITISGLLHLYIITALVLDLDPLYQPRFVIPIAGMIFANTMNVISIAIERFEKERLHNDFITSRNNAFKACMIPQINTLLAVGLVALPGMMTGQILSGIDPVIAVRYQIMIMSMILSSSGIAIVSYFIIKEKFYE